MAKSGQAVNYCDFVNFKSELKINPEELWKQKKQKTSIAKQIRNAKPLQMAQSKLLSSALMKIRYENQRRQIEALQDVMSQSSSNFILSRQNTPANFVFPKKKNKHKTVASDLFDIQSKGSQGKKKDEDMFQGLILYPYIIGLSEVVYAQALGKQKKINPKLIHTWKDCLLPEDKQQIFGANAPYSFSRIFPINELEKGFNEIYGSGKKRSLRIGQESLLISYMQKYLQKCNIQITKIARKDYDILNDILRAAKLQQLQQLPICMKQVQLIWKVLATQWRYSGKLDLKNRLLQSALVNGRSNFWDLRKSNPITSFLLSHSNQNENLEQN